MEHVTNEEVFNRANAKSILLDGLLKRRLAFHGHLVRTGGITLDLMIGHIHGTRPRGRPRTTWLKDLATQANINYTEAITYRETWLSGVVSATQEGHHMRDRESNGMVNNLCCPKISLVLLKRTHQNLQSMFSRKCYWQGNCRSMWLMHSKMNSLCSCYT